MTFFDFPGLDLSGYAEVLGGLHHLAIAVSPRKWETLKARLTEHDSRAVSRALQFVALFVNPTSPFQDSPGLQ